GRRRARSGSKVRKSFFAKATKDTSRQRLEVKRQNSYPCARPCHVKTSRILWKMQICSRNPMYRAIGIRYLRGVPLDSESNRGARYMAAPILSAAGSYKIECPS